MNEPLFEKTKIGTMELKNRFVRSATWEGMAGAGGEVTTPLIELYSELARGEVGLILTGFSYVNIKGKAVPAMMGADSDMHIPGLKKLTAAVHKAGGKIALQIAHGGSQCNFDTGLGTEAPSAVKERSTGNMPKPMSRADIKRVISDFAEAARRAKESGFDAVEIHAAHGYLLSQFLSPFSNQRTDAYGGTIKKRARIVTDVYEAVREKVGPDFPVMIKINSADFDEVGLTPEDSVWVCKRLSKLGIDAIELSGGLPASTPKTPARLKIDTPEKEAYFKDYAKGLKPLIKCPLILVGGLRSIEVIEGLYDDGTADFFSLARPLISEPDLIKRWHSGDREKGRCISCNKCMTNAFTEARLYCSLDTEG
ncbi:MAG: NADH:flavin oxidoreductase [Thermodesulfobacteriota bacterium]